MAKQLNPRKMADLAGHRFGRLVVLRLTATPARRIWLCRCDCGEQRLVDTHRLQIGHTTSCGCFKREKAAESLRTHGMRDSREYRIWCNMKERCYTTTRAHYPRYGGRGIQVCERWRGSFENFYADLGPCPSPKHSLEREDNEGHYQPTNCRWATPVEQARNKRDNRLLTFRGHTKCVTEWAEEIGMKVGTLHYRIQHGWSADKALTEPVKRARLVAELGE